MQNLTPEQLLKLLQELPEWKQLNEKVKTLESKVKDLENPEKTFFPELIGKS